MTMRRLSVSLLLGVGLAVSSVLGPLHPLVVTAEQSDTAVLSVQADHTIGPISRYIYGVNDAAWSMVAPAMQPQSMAAGVTWLRYPGGNWGDQHDLQSFLVDLYITSARQRNAEPTISVRLKGSTPDAAAALVHYVNIEKQYGVHYWSIGNEPDLYPNYTVEQYVKDWRAFAVAMKAVDPSIVFVGPDISQYPPTNDGYSAHFHDYLKTFLQADGDMVGIVSVHRYPFPPGLNAPPTTIDELRSSAREWDTIIPAIHATIQSTVGHDLPVGVTEINSNWAKAAGGPADPDSFFHAIWWADVLGHMIRQQVDVVAYWLLSTDNSDTSGLLSHSDVRPTYYVYLLYKQFGDTLLQSQSSDPDVTVTAAMRKDGALTLMVINPADQAKTVPISLTGFAPGAVTLWRLDSTHTATEIGASDEIGAGTLKLPAQSASLYVISPK